ncbi:MAG: hypothetical protein WAM04_01950 [Candidatus Sulfotelmatobacter sp.]
MADGGRSSRQTAIIAVCALLGAIILGILFFLSDLGGAIGNTRR